MGSCQGRYCAPVAANLVAELAGRERHVDEAFASRPPVKPSPIAALAREKPE